MNNIKDWSAVCDHLYLWDYCTNFRNYLQPFPNLFTMAENIRAYRDLGIKGVLQQGNFSYGGGAALDDLKAYVIARLLWNPDMDVHALVDEFTEGVYGKGGPYMKEYIYKISEAVNGEIPMGIYDFPDAEYFNDTLIAECAALFDQAEEAAESTEIRERIRRERLSVTFLQVSRMEDNASRSTAVDEFAKELQHFKITEIRERIDLYQSLETMRKHRYAASREGERKLYYIMQ